MRTVLEPDVSGLTVQEDPSMIGAMIGGGIGVFVVGVLLGGWVSNTMKGRSCSVGNRNTNQYDQAGIGMQQQGARGPSSSREELAVVEAREDHVDM